MTPYFNSSQDNKILDHSIFKTQCKINVGQRICFRQIRKRCWELEKIFMTSIFSLFQFFFFFFLLKAFFLFAIQSDNEFYIVTHNLGLINHFPNKPLFLCVWSTSLLKTLEKRRNFSFSHTVSYPSGDVSAIFIKFKIVVYNLFQFESKICCLGKS